MHFLIIKTSSLGDIVQSFPILDYLHSKFDGLKIDWIVEEAWTQFLESHPLIHKVIPVSFKRWRQIKNIRQSFPEFLNCIKEIRQSKYDCIFDLQGNIKSGILTSCARGKQKIGFGYKTVAEWPNLLATNKRYDIPKGQGIREDYLNLVQTHFNDKASFVVKNFNPLKMGKASEELLLNLAQKIANDQRVKILICSGSNWINKKLTEQTWLDFLTSLSSTISPFFLLLWGSSEEKIFAEKINIKFPDSSMVLPKLDLPTLQNLIVHLDGVIAMDSMPLHLAATTSTPTFSVFGASSAKKYAPSGKMHHAIQGSCPYGKTFEKRCPILRTCPTGACIHNLKGDQLAAEFLQWWDSLSSR